MGRALDPKKIKSAQRVLEVLEFFNGERQEGTVMDIARAYDYPQSSTSELLSCLVALGYLRRDAYARTYKPAARVAVLGAWTQPSLFRKGALLPLMDELAEEAGATVLLASKVGLEVQLIHVVAPAGRGAGLKTGDVARLLHSPPGKALLSTLTTDLQRKIVHRLNAESPEDLRVRFDDLKPEVDAVKASGYAAGAFDETRGMVSVLLPQNGSDDEALALTICAPAAMIAADEDRYVRLLRAAISRHLGLVEVDRPEAFPLLRQTG